MCRWIVRRLSLVLTGMLLSSVTLSGLGADEPEYRLAYKFQTKQKVHYEVKHDMTIHTQIGEASETVRNKSTTRKHFRVASVEADGTAVLEPVIDHVVMTARFGDTDPIRWDSRKDSRPPPQFRRIAETIGKSRARMKVAPNGELVWSDLREADLKVNFLVVFPEHPLRVGESWQDEIAVKVTVGKKLQRPVKLRRRYTLKSVADDRATIALKTSLLQPVNNPEIRGQLLLRRPAGTIEFDLKRGVIVSRELKIDEQVIGIADGKGLMRGKSHHRERLVRPEQTARRPAGPPAAPGPAK